MVTSCQTWAVLVNSTRSSCRGMTKVASSKGLTSPGTGRPAAASVCGLPSAPAGTRSTTNSSRRTETEKCFTSVRTTLWTRSCPTSCSTMRGRTSS